MKYTADIEVRITVEFDDDHETDLRDQAIDAAKDHLGHFEDYDMRIVGNVKLVAGRG